MDAGSVSAFQQGQVQTQAGVSVLKKRMDAEQQAANALMNGFNQAEATISSASKEPGKGQYIDVHA